MKTEEVFGVSTKPVASYVQRTTVDDRFSEALKSDKQIVIYGSSKQGKTALVQTHLPYDRNLVVRLTPRTQISDIYASILRQLNIQIEETTTEAAGREASASVKVGFKAMIPMFGGADSSIKGEGKTTSDKETQYKVIPFNLELPQDISELMKQAGRTETPVILENFHYLDDDRQKQLAFDLRTFQELGIRFVILGVWREKDRMTQFNGDLVDRVIEVPVEPWLESDFLRVAQKGENALNIKISAEIIEKAGKASFSSIGVYQEILKEICLNAGVEKRAFSRVEINDEIHLSNALRKKASDYTTRHQRALESIAAGNPNSGGRAGVIPLFLPYYIVRVVLEGGFEGLANGMPRSVIHAGIQKIHHRPADVRPSDMSNLLHNLAALQSTKNISPPIVDYDQSTKRLQVVDSTFYFFLKNANLKEILEEIANPLDNLRDQSELPGVSA
jgi:hypothetical protein